MKVEVQESQSQHPKIEQTRFVLVAGPLGAGKTTFINNLLEQYGDRLGTVAVIVNDFGEQNIDASRIRADAIRGLSHECVCCGSWKELADTLVEVNGQYSTVIIEPTGVADPKRVRQVVAEKGFPLHTIAVTDSQNIERNDALGLQGPAIEVADQVLVSRLDSEGLSDLSVPKNVQEYISFRREDIAPIALKNAHVPPKVLDAILAERSMELGVSTHHRHGEHVPGHAFSRLTLNLYSDVSIDDIAIQLRSFPECIERAKGTAVDGPFDFVHGEISSLGRGQDPVSIAPSKLQMILISSSPKMNFTHFTAIGIPPVPELADLEFRSTLYPDLLQVLNSNERLTPHFEEADATYAKMYPIRNIREEIADKSERDAFDQKWQLTLANYLNYRAELANLLTSDLSLGVENDAQRAYLLRETGLILAWHALNYQSDIDANQHAAIVSARPATLFFEGCASATKLSDFAAHGEFSDGVISEILDVARFGLQYENLAIEQIKVQLLKAATVLTEKWNPEQVDKLLQAIERMGK